MRAITSKSIVACVGLLLILLTVAAIGTASAGMKKSADKPPFKEDLLDEYSKKLEIDYILPRPGAISEVLKKYQFTFTGQITPNAENGYTDGVKIALNLGVRCADGIMMLYQQDNLAEKNIRALGETIQKLTENLGLREQLKEVDALKAAIKSKDRAEIKKRIDTLFAEAETFLRHRDDNDLALLISLGGWLEMMYHAAGELSKNYQPQSTKVIAQSNIVDVYITALNRLKLFVEGTPVLKAIARQLPRVKQLMETSEDEPLSRKAVNEIFTIAQNLKHEIEKK